MRVLKIPSTEKQPFVAHAHGIRSAELRARMRMPIGKSMPIEKASGKMAATAIAMRAVTGLETVAAKRSGESHANSSPVQTIATTTAPTKGWRR